MRPILALCACAGALVPTRCLPSRRVQSLRAIELADAAQAVLEHVAPLVDTWQHATPFADAVAAAQHALPTSLQAASDATEAIEAERAIDALGRDIFAFLAASVLVVPTSRAVGAPPVLGFLAIGCVLGPHGLGVFGDVESDVALGDFGILFLLFNEGLNLSPERLRKLGEFLKLGLAQFILTVAVFFFFSFYLGPELVPIVDKIVPFPIDDALLKTIEATPVAAFCVAAAGSLSSSALVLPVLEAKGWKDLPEGAAALSILLLQDLAVAPILVALPLVAGGGSAVGDSDIALLAFKATIGCGAVILLGNRVLRVAFDAVAAARSTETFVAATLLVAVGMGRLAEAIGLSATTGAFAAGVLLAGNRYRAQIKADIRPFEGILLGVFFMAAGAGFDPGLVLQELPTLTLGVVGFLLVKTAVLFASGPVLGLDVPRSARVAVLLSPGGEFAFIIFKLAEDLGVLSSRTSELLTTSVILSMALSPLVAEFAQYAGDELDRLVGEGAIPLTTGGTVEDEVSALFKRVDADGDGTIDLDELRVYVSRRGFPAAQADRAFAAIDTDGDGTLSLDEWRAGLNEPELGQLLRPETGTELEDAVVVCGYGPVGRAAAAAISYTDVPVVAVDLDPARVADGVVDDAANVVYGDGASETVLKAAGVTKPRAIVVAYAGADRRAEAVARLRASFPDAPIIARAGGGPLASEGRELEKNGASVVHEATQMGLGLAEQVVGVDLDRVQAEAAVYSADAKRPRAAAAAAAAPGRPLPKFNWKKLGLPKAPPSPSGWRPLGRSLRKRFAKRGEDADDV